MIPQKQTILVGNPEGRLGNCLQAAVASILELHINDVPHFIEEDDWKKCMTDFLKKHGYGWVECGIEFNNGISIACGTSPRGVYHACVANNGEIIFDPHPSNDGILKIEWHWVLNKLNQDNS